MRREIKKKKGKKSPSKLLLIVNGLLLFGVWAGFIVSFVGALSYVTGEPAHSILNLIVARIGFLVASGLRLITKIISKYIIDGG